MSNINHILPYRQGRSQYCVYRNKFPLAKINQILTTWRHCAPDRHSYLTFLNSFPLAHFIHALTRILKHKLCIASRAALQPHVMHPLESELLFNVSEQEFMVSDGISDGGGRTPLFHGHNHRTPGTYTEQLR